MHGEPTGNSRIKCHVPTKWYLLRNMPLLTTSYRPIIVPFSSRVINGEDALNLISGINCVAEIQVSLIPKH
jgi:hypothetical protein